MIDKKLLLLIAFCLRAAIAFSQETTEYKSRWHINASIGGNIPLTKLMKGQATDYLIGYRDVFANFQLISTTIFLTERWGVNGSFNFGYSPKISKNKNKFIKRMQDEYGESYFLLDDNNQNEYSSLSEGGVLRGTLGIVYRFESEKFYIYPQLSGGVTSLSISYRRFYLKEKNSNNVFELTYSPNKTSYDRFTIVPSCLFGYKLGKRIFLNLNVSSSYFRSDISFTKTITDINSSETSESEVEYNKGLFSIGVGVGGVLVLR